MHFVLVSLLLAHNETQSVLHLVHPAPHAKLCQVCEKGTRGLWRIKRLQDYFVFIYLFKPHSHACSTTFVLFVFTIITSIYIFYSISLTQFSHLLRFLFAKVIVLTFRLYSTLYSELLFLFSFSSNQLYYNYFPFKSLLATFVLHMYKWKQLNDLALLPGWQLGMFPAHICGIPMLSACLSSH